MGRLQIEFMDRIERFAHRVMDVAEVLIEQKRPAWFTDQLGSSGAAVGANAFEADQSVSRKDFCRYIGYCAREASETRYWIRTVARRQWIPPARLTELEAEALALQSIFASMIRNTKRNQAEK